MKLYNSLTFLVLLQPTSVQGDEANINSNLQEKIRQEVPRITPNLGSVEEEGRPFLESALKDLLQMTIHRNIAIQSSKMAEFAIQRSARLLRNSTIPPVRGWMTCLSLRSTPAVVKFIYQSLLFGSVLNTEEHKLQDFRSDLVGCSSQVGVGLTIGHHRSCQIDLAARRPAKGPAGGLDPCR